MRRVTKVLALTAAAIAAAAIGRARAGAAHEAGLLEAARDGADCDASAPDAETAESTYAIVRHASITGRPASDGVLAWVVVAHWRFEGGQEGWYTEYWDDRRNEEAPEEQHPSHEEAVIHAEERFGALTWMPGGPPL